MQAFLRKLKFQYLQQNAKDKYIKMIVSDIDDAPLITAAANEELHARNLAKKDALRAAKERLAGKQGDVRALAPLVEQGECAFHCIYRKEEGREGRG